MPNLLGLTLTEAEATLLKYDLEKGNVDWDFSIEQANGKIYRQFPYDAGKEVTKGDQVDLFVSLGYPKGVNVIPGEVLVVQDESKTSEVTITIRDSRGRDIVWKKEMITGSKYYDQIELILMPGDKGTISIYLDDALYQQKPVFYY